MEDVDKEPEERKTTLQDLLFFAEKFEGHNTCVGDDINSREQQENNTRANQQEQQAPEDVIYDNGTAQQQLQENQYEVGKTDTRTQVCTHVHMYVQYSLQLADTVVAKKTVR